MWYNDMTQLISCLKFKNIDYYEKLVQKLLDKLPHGSGIDGKHWLVLEESNVNKIVIGGSYHKMNENGLYDGWISYRVIIVPSFINDYDIRIRGRFNGFKNQQIKYQLYMTYDLFLRNEGGEIC